MRVSTKHGYGTLIGMTIFEVQGKNELAFVVLLDDAFIKDYQPEELEWWETRPVKERIYTCWWIEVLEESGQQIEIKGKDIPFRTVKSKNQTDKTNEIKATRKPDSDRRD